MTRISSSAVRMYSECSKRYDLHYNKRLRSKTTNGAFLFGLAIDHGLNHLLQTNNLEESISIFEKSWAAQNINGVLTTLKTAHNIVYAAKDFDGDLLEEKDREAFYNHTAPDNRLAEEIIKELKDKKSEKGYENFSDEEKEFYAVGHWLSMRRKGHIMLRDYQKKVMPRIKKVHSIQKNFSMSNPDGDSIIGYIDLIAEMDDGKTYILDNKTSSSLYQWDSPMRSQQLILYYHAEKEEFKLDGVGFIVCYKAIKKNRTKICSLCSTDGSAGRHKTCAAERIFIPSGFKITDTHKQERVRCNGEFIETLSPECEIDVLLNFVPEAAENLVLETFDRANDGIKKEVFAPNLFQCGDSNSEWRCQFYNLCWKNSDKDLIKLDEK